MKIPNGARSAAPGFVSLARIVSEDSQLGGELGAGSGKSSKDS